MSEESTGKRIRKHRVRKALDGFKEFISRGNAIDLAVGVVIGASFSAVITALTEKFLSPLIAGLFGQPSFDTLGQFHLQLFGGAPALVQPGAILTALVNFLLVAFALYFFMVYPMNLMNQRKEASLAIASEGDENTLEVSPEVQLLTDIRDALVKQS